MFPFWFLKLNQETEVLKAFTFHQLKVFFPALINIYFAWEKTGII